MSHETRILNLFKIKNYIITEEVENAGIFRGFLSFLIDKNKIIRLSRGIYTLPNELEDEYFIIDTKSKYDITTLYFHELCNKISLKYDVTVKSVIKILYKKTRILICII